MKNHFGRTGLPSNLPDDDVDEALLHAAERGDAQLSADVDAAREALDAPLRRTHYRRVHLQYRALAAALDALDAPVATDTHRWRERLVEFVPGGQPPS